MRWERVARGVRWCRAASLGVLGVLSVMPAAAQVIDTNRPGFTFAPSVVPVGQLQLETGAGYDDDGGGFGAPQAELRYGVAPDLEVFIASINWVDGSFGDTSFGTKLALTGSSGALQSALLLQVSAPTGDDAVSSDRWDPGAGFIWAYSGAVALAGTLKVTRFDRGVQLDNGLKLILPRGRGRSAFAEWELNRPEHGRTAHWLNMGHQWLMSDQLQLDINAGVGLNNAAGNYRFGLGLSRLF